MGEGSIAFKTAATCNIARAFFLLALAHAQAMMDEQLSDGRVLEGRLSWVLLIVLVVLLPTWHCQPC